MCARCSSRRRILGFALLAGGAAVVVWGFKIPFALAVGFPVLSLVSLCLAFGGLAAAAPALRWLAPRARALLRGISGGVPAAGLVAVRGRASALFPLVAPVSESEAIFVSLRGESRVAWRGELSVDADVARPFLLLSAGGRRLRVEAPGAEIDSHGLPEKKRPLHSVYLDDFLDEHVHRQRRRARGDYHRPPSYSTYGDVSERLILPGQEITVIGELSGAAGGGGLYRENAADPVIGAGRLGGVYLSARTPGALLGRELLRLLGGLALVAAGVSVFCYGLALFS